MKKPAHHDSDQLRRAAEAKLVGERLSNVTDRSADELLHELHVHQIELERQNEHLRQAHSEMEISRDRYADIYDFAPVGYLTLSRSGMISRVNLTAANLFGAERLKLIKYRFANLIVPEDRERWDHYFLSVLQADSKQNCELSLRHGPLRPIMHSR